MYVEVITESGSRIQDSDDPIRRTKAKFETQPRLVFEDDESKILLDFSNYVLSTDPDIIIFSNTDLTILRVNLR